MTLSNLVPMTKAARLLDKSEALIRYYSDKGDLACLRDAFGRRFFDLSELRRFAKEKGWTLRDAS